MEQIGSYGFIIKINLFDADRYFLISKENLVQRFHIIKISSAKRPEAGVYFVLLWDDYNFAPYESLSYLGLVFTSAPKAVGVTLKEHNKHK